MNTRRNNIILQMLSSTLFVITATAIGLVLTGCELDLGAASDDLLEELEKLKDEEVAVAITDAPSDNLSELNLEITAIRLIHADGFDVEVLAPAVRLTVNILSLRNRNLLASVTRIPIGNYEAAEIDFRNATATHAATGLALAVDPPSGTLELEFENNVTVVNGQSTGMVIDIDASQLVDKIDLKDGEIELELELDKTHVDEGTIDLDDFKGIVTASGPNGLTVRVERHGQALTEVTCRLPAGTEPVPVGAKVEIDGSFGPGGVVRAKRIEIEDVDTDGPDQLEAMVLEIADGFARCLLMEVEDGLVPDTSAGSFLIDLSQAVLKRDDGANAELSLQPGQRIECQGLVVDGIFEAALVELRHTHVDGVLVSLDPPTLQVAEIERFRRSDLPTQVELTGLDPRGLRLGDDIEIEGFFGDPAGLPRFSVGEDDSDLEIEIEIDLGAGAELFVDGDPLAATGFRFIHPTLGEVNVRMAPGARLTLELEALDVEIPLSLVGLLVEIAGGHVLEIEIEGRFASDGTFLATEVEIEVP